MLPEVNTTNPNFKIFQSSVVGSMQEAEHKRKKKEDTRLKNVKELKNKDQYSSTAHDENEQERLEVEDSLDKLKKKNKDKNAKFKYVKKAYLAQSTLNPNTLPLHSQDQTGEDF